MVSVSVSVSEVVVVLYDQLSSQGLHMYGGDLRLVTDCLSLCIMDYIKKLLNFW